MIRAIVISFLMGCILTWTYTYPRAYEDGLYYGDYGKGKVDGRQEMALICYDWMEEDRLVVIDECMELIDSAGCEKAGFY